MVEYFKTFQSSTTTISFPVEEPTETVAAPKEVSNQVEADVAPETEPALVDKRTDKSDKKSTHVPTAEEEEIDDVEPGEDEDLVEEIFDEEEEEEEVVEPQNEQPEPQPQQQQQHQQQELDTSRLLASGISVTIIEKSKQKSTEETALKTTKETAPKVATEIALGSDVR